MDLISRQAAIDALDCINGVEEVLRSLPSAHPDVPEINVGDMISRQAAIDELSQRYIIMDNPHYIGYNAGLDEAQKVIKALPSVQPKNGTLIIPLNESDFKSVKRIMLDNKPWCRMFYEEGGEAHWIKKYTPDDGEVYECDNCGVTWQFNDGGPEENEAFFCPKCGFEMVRGEADG